MNTAQTVATTAANNARVNPTPYRGLLPLLGEIASNLRDSRRRQRDYQHLLELPDYLLTDIGLTRQQLVEARRRRPF